MSVNNANNPQFNYPPQMPDPGTPQAASPRKTGAGQLYYTPSRMIKNKFLTFLFACLPGAGQMYHGLMRKGISIMLLFFGIFGLSIISYVGVLNVLLPVIWFYSFFDTVNRMNMSLDELKSLKDGYLFLGEGQISPKVNGGELLTRLLGYRHRVIGVCLILLGGWIFLNSLFGSWYGDTFLSEFMDERAYYAAADVIRTLPTLVIPVLCIFIGAKLIRGDSRKKPAYDEYTIPREASNGDKRRSVAAQREEVEQDPYWQGVTQVDEKPKSAEPSAEKQAAAEE